MIRRALLGLLLVGCGSPHKDPVADGGVLRAAGLKGIHLASCSDPTCGNGANPPLGGDHCASTLPCRRYDIEQARCLWIHNLEHGHAVLAYNCPAGCPELLAQLNAVWESRQSDTLRKRILVTPDPKLPFKMAAVVWGFGWQGDTFDAAAVDEVLSHQDGEAPEAFLGCAP